MQNLYKYYAKTRLVSKIHMRVVDNVNLAICQSECFGLLGVNGAGKTTIFKMITGEVKISKGEIYISGFNYKKQWQPSCKYTGYCPQIDAVLDELTGFQLLTIFGLIRGIEPQPLKILVQDISVQVGFKKHLNKKIKEYSGGNKRKLSLALAIIGNPPIILLDEPTAGIDPSSKRKIWNVLSALRDNGICIVLTSHSMEECEALCTRIGIMVNGQFKCLGSKQHLKTKFSEGYTLSIKIKKIEDKDLAERKLLEFINQHFPNAELKERYLEIFTYFIPGSVKSWSKLFGVMEDAKRSINIIADYTLTQTTLEQIFLSFAQKQVDV